MMGWSKTFNNLHGFIAGRRKQLALWTLVCLCLAGALKFYHYNFVANTRGQARMLRLPGLEELVCKGVPFTSGSVDQCGTRAIYGEADWGITAYITIHGIETLEEAQAIAAFMVEARKKNGQESIPMDVEIYSIPRSAGSSRPSEYKIFDQRF